MPKIALIPSRGIRSSRRCVWPTPTVDGTLNTFRAAAAAGASRFVYASSVAAYGFHTDNPVPMTEDWPVRPAARLFYAQEKAELEQRLQEEDAKTPDLDLYVLRPSIVSSNGELNRLSDGDNPKPPIQRAYSSADIPSGTSALTARRRGSPG